ncbi:MAG: hypothetical protein CMK65_01110 [Pseudoalteromonas sp.]|uniref:oligosaccharide flippase family protein n=1 Tax=Pseudoalteromonas sp. TaxID=53249 RepID=UPI000C91A550|nr:polysaccharide biosynthesis C-terminal domain-containing protein [Pseudoalteromonas sp.]MAD02213.1 hypothetical protein [Pseudoalteromonas sp.]|tara:strand:+ start:68095 stop:69417 length:1323 start_codon:yes stop_codon:yes gene_type:complete
MSIVRDSSYLALSNLILVFSSLATGILTARLLGPEGRGELFLLIQITSLGGLIICCGLGPSYQYHLKKGLFDKTQILSHILVQLILGCGLIVFLFIFGEPLWTFVANKPIDDDIRFWACVALMINVMINFYTYVLMSMEGGIKLNSIFGVASSLGNMVFLGLLVWLFELGVFGAIVAYCLSISLKVLPVLPKIFSGVWRDIRLRWLGISKPLYKYGFSAFLSNLMVSTVFRIDVFILSALSGVKAVGIYSIAVAFAEMALMVPRSVGMALFAHLPDKPIEEQIEIIKRSSSTVFLLALISGLGLLVMSYPLVMILMGDDYIDAVLPLCLLVPGVVAMSVNFVFSNFFSASGRPIIGVYCFASGLVANVLLCYLLIPIYGVAGAALASTLAYAAITLAFLFMLKYHHQVSVLSLFKVYSKDFAFIKDKFGSIVAKLLSRKG